MNDVRINFGVTSSGSRCSSLLYYALNITSIEKEPRVRRCRSV